MTHTFLSPAIATALLFAVNAFPGQTPRTNPTPTNTPSDAITVKGCVAESMGRYMLDKAAIVTPIPTPVPPAATEPPQKSPADDHIYALIGPQVKAHVGHHVEITGTMPPKTADPNAQAPERTAHPMAGTVNVKTITMLAATCP